MTSGHRALRDVGTIDDTVCREFQHSVELVGRKWSAAIMLALARGAQRFGELQHAVDGISTRLLAARLAELQENALVERTVIPTTPVQVSYALTPCGRELLANLVPLIKWRQKWHAGEKPA